MSTIRLDPVLFDALHLAALANGGVGYGTATDRKSLPVCATGLSAWVEGRELAPNQLYLAATLLGRVGNFDAGNADEMLKDAKAAARIAFPEWCRIVDVDVGP